MNIATIIAELIRNQTAITAGTTQTQAGATRIKSRLVLVTTGNASDGVRLPPADYGEFVVIVNLSAAALKVYPDTSDKLNGGSANAASAHAASKMGLYIATGKENWYSLIGA